jgi:hypothetical protein
MLNKFDDFPIHQTPEPIAHPASSDRNVYDRTWFNGYTADGSAYFGIGIAIYPYRRVLDCAFSVVYRDGRQHSFYGSRLAPLERTDMRVGPFRLEVSEPLRRARVILDSNETGIACDLTFSARTAGIQEARQILTDGQRKIMDATRFAQFGYWDGTISDPDGGCQVVNWLGTKDRSWGIRMVGEPEAPGAPSQGRGFFFLWTPVHWDNEVTHSMFFDKMDGGAIVREGITAPKYQSESAIPEQTTSTVHHSASVSHRIQYVPGTRHMKYAEIDYVELDGSKRTLAFDPMLQFQMKGLGYGHPVWKQGAWMGEYATFGESFVVADLDPLRPEHLHTQQICKVTDGKQQGVGAFELIVIGPYAPGGFRDYLDGAR